MIKRILVALDPDGDTPVATRFAIRLAKKFDASVTGLAVVDTSNLQSAMGVGGYGTQISGQTIWAEMAEETRKVAEELLNDFKNAVEKAGVRHRDVQMHGASTELIIEEMKYHDLLIVGKDSRFFYNQPEKDTGTLAKVVKKGHAPTLIVTDEYRDVERIMIAFDGSGPAARTLKGFVHLLPYGKDIEIELIIVSEGDSIEEMDRASRILSQAEAYLKEHGFYYISKKVMEKGKPGERFLNLQMGRNPDLLLLGAHSVSAIRRAAFGSTTQYMVENSQGPLFLSP
ncbi:universal stress protein [Rhodohalobacter sp. SW132]|uniref:universal stress protein n=1 Tax=Rhodohalobacter sp. SW132 TaxID=2293433 RepID=UPI000E224C95|nr:universal stress protein [Rhodohalobacter sp. SW132]REL37727.1 universal stress protein [Rhodohalobacter sp. SW132]